MTIYMILYDIFPAGHIIYDICPAGLPPAGPRKRRSSKRCGVGNGSRRTDVTEIERVLSSSARPISVKSNACGMPVMYHWLPYVGSSVGLLLAKSRFHCFQRYWFWGPCIELV